MFRLKKQKKPLSEGKKMHNSPPFILILEGLSVKFVVGISLGCVAAVGAICGVVAALVIYV